MTPSHIQPLAPGAVQAAASVMARAFHGDPAWRWVIPGDERRSRVLPTLFAAALRLEQLRGHVVTAAEGAGVAIWVPPASPSSTLVQTLRSGLPLVVLRLRPAERLRLRRYLTANIELRRSALPVCWFLGGVGVDPERQRSGIGTALITWIAGREVPCGLLTSAPENVAFYERRGFAVVSERTDADGALRLWAMLRR